MKALMKLPAEGKLLRIFLGEADRWRGQPLSEAIVEAARCQGLAGRHSVEGLQGIFLPALDEMVQEGLVTLERAEVIHRHRKNRRRQLVDSRL
jgi:uncharacterized protein